MNVMEYGTKIACKARHGGQYKLAGTGHSPYLKSDMMNKSVKE